MNILFIGDISGKAGRRAFHQHFLPVIEEYEIDFSVANVENAAGGYGVTPKVVEEFFDSGLDALTSGNHIWDRNEALSLLESESRLLRPLNYPDPCPGRGLYLSEKRVRDPVCVINIQGRVFMDPIDCPFQAMDEALKNLQAKVRIILVDFHGEATSEKIAMGWHLDGRVSAVIGTHTHVQTADERILPNGTAYITDVGMTGSFDSVIGVHKEAALERFVTGRQVRLTTASGDRRFSALVIRIDPKTGMAASVERLFR